MENSGNSKNIVKKKTPNVKNMSKEDIKAALLKKKECDFRALKIVERLIENPVPAHWFVYSLRYINQSHLDDIIEERSLLKQCGYPICTGIINSAPKQQYAISTRTNKVYDITERKKFCSDQCYKAFIFIKEQMFTSPLWLRDKEEIPNFKLLPWTTKGVPGLEVDFGIPKVEIEPSFASVADFAKDSLDDAPDNFEEMERDSFFEFQQEINSMMNSQSPKNTSRSSKIKTKNSTEERITRKTIEAQFSEIMTEDSKFKLSKHELKLINLSDKSRKSESEKISIESLKQRLENRQKAMLKQEKEQPKESKSQDVTTITQNIETLSLCTTNENENSINIKCNSIKSDRILEKSVCGHNIEFITNNDVKVLDDTDKNSQEKKSHENFSVIQQEKKILGENLKETNNTLQIKIQNYLTEVNENKNVLSHHVTLSGNEVNILNKETEENLNQAGVVPTGKIKENEKLKKFEPSEKMTNTKKEYTDIELNMESNNSSKNNRVVSNTVIENEVAEESNKIESNIVQKRINNLHEENVRRSKQNVKETISLKDNVQKRLQNRSNLSTTELAIQHVENCVSEWITIDSLIFIHGEEKVHDEVSKHSEIIQEKIKQSLDNSNLLYRSEAYLQLCKQIDLLEFNENRWEEKVNKPLKPLPDYRTLRAENKRLIVKVRSFYKGTMEIEEPDYSESETEEENSDDENDRIILPTVDKKSQNVLRRRIVYNYLNKTIPGILQSFGLVSHDMNSEIRELIGTFALTAKNIVFKPIHLNLLSVIILKILAEKNRGLYKLMEDSTAVKYTNLLLSIYKLPADYLTNLINKVMDIENIVNVQLRS